MIHIISNQTAFKSGATNVHGSEYWLNNNPLKYATYKNKHMGVQLDATHEITGSKTREVTQMISALAQNPDTADKAHEMYENLANIIKDSAEPYLKSIQNLDADGIKKLYSNLSKDLVKHLAQSNDRGLAKTIAETFEYGKLLPFSNQNFFKSFVENLVINMNQDFITRYYPGTGAILLPSHKIVQIYNDANGNTFTQADLAKEAIQDSVANPNLYHELDPTGQTIQLNTEQIIEKYISEKFPPVDLTTDKVQIGDVIAAGEEVINLDTLDKYYKFKQNYQGQLVKKLLNVPRDLKPIEITFTIAESGLTKNLFDLDSTRLRYVFESIIENKEKD
jgi:hypothetical protein